MKKLEKKSMPKILGGAQEYKFCMPLPGNQKVTHCQWIDTCSGKVCIGMYTWGGETLMLQCNDDYKYPAEK